MSAARARALVALMLPSGVAGAAANGTTSCSQTVPGTGTAIRSRYDETAASALDDRMSE